MTGMAVRTLVPKVFEFACPACGFHHDVTLEPDSLGTYGDCDESGRAFKRHCISCCAHIVLPAFEVSVTIAYFDENTLPP